MIHSQAIECQNLKIQHRQLLLFSSPMKLKFEFSDQFIISKKNNLSAKNYENMEKSRMDEFSKGNESRLIYT